MYSYMIKAHSILNFVTFKARRDRAKGLKQKKECDNCNSACSSISKSIAIYSSIENVVEFKVCMYIVTV